MRRSCPRSASITQSRVLATRAATWHWPPADEASVSALVRKKVNSKSASRVSDWKTGDTDVTNWWPRPLRQSQNLPNRGLRIPGRASFRLRQLGCYGCEDRGHWKICGNVGPKVPYVFDPKCGTKGTQYLFASVSPRVRSDVPCCLDSQSTRVQRLSGSRTPRELDPTVDVVFHQAYHVQFEEPLLSARETPSATLLFASARYAGSTNDASTSRQL